MYIHSRLPRDSGFAFVLWLVTRCHYCRGYVTCYRYLSFDTDIIIIMNIIKVQVLGPVPLKLKVFLVSPSASRLSHIPPSPRLELESQHR
jgi:hypothetical protein